MLGSPAIKYKIQSYYQTGKLADSKVGGFVAPLRKVLNHLLFISVISLLIISLPLHAAEAESDKPLSEQFDELYQQAENEEVDLTTINRLVFFLETLKKKIPEGDDKRRRQYEYYACLSGYDFQVDESEEAIQKYIDEAKQSGDEEAQARFYYCLAQYQGAQSKWQAAIESSTQAIELAKENNLFSLTAISLANRCSLSSLIGRYAKSLADCLEAKDIYQSIGDTESSQTILFDIGIAYRRVGFFEKSLEFFDELEAYSKEKGLTGGIVQTRLQKSYIYQAKKQFMKALKLQNSALEFADKNQIAYENGSIYIAKADTYNELMRFSDALEELEKAKRFYSRMGVSTQDETLEYLAGRAYTGIEQPEKGYEHLKRAEEMMLASGNERYLVWVYEALAESNRAMGRHEAAVSALNKHKQLSAKLNQQKNEQQTLVLRYQFDSERQALENQRLKAEQELKNKELESLKKAKQWQTVALILGIVLTAILVTLVVRQILLSSRLKKLALTDSLTGTANRRHIEQYCTDAMKMADTNNSTVSMIVFDIDHFKKVNDQYGHTVGDEVLKSLTNFCSNALRNDDRLGRYGGEEFVIVLPNTALGQAYRVAERLRVGVEGLILDAEGKVLKITISLGVAEYQPNESMKELIERADKALYQAKDAGRNQTIKIEVSKT